MPPTQRTRASRRRTHRRRSVRRNLTRQHRRHTARRNRRGGMLGRFKPLGKSAVLVGKQIANASADVAVELGKNQVQQELFQKGPIAKYNKQVDYLKDKENVYNQFNTRSPTPTPLSQTPLQNF